MFCNQAISDSAYSSVQELAKGTANKISIYVGESKGFIDKY